MILALLSQAKGVAVFDDGTRLGYIRPQSSAAHYASDHQLAKIIQGATDLEPLSVADLHALYTHLRLRMQRGELLHAAIVMLCSEFSPEVRSLAASRVAASDESPDWNWAQGILASTPMPEESNLSFVDKLPKAQKIFFESLADARERIQALRLAWNGISDRVFQKDDREGVLSTFIRNSIFSTLLFGPRDDENPFACAIARYSINTPKLKFHHGYEPSGTIEPQQSIAPLIGDVAPWRAAWMATAWPVFEARTACETADLLIYTAHHASYFSRNDSNSLFVPHRLSNAWSRLRHSPNTSPWISVVKSVSNNTIICHQDIYRSIANFSAADVNSSPPDIFGRLLSEFFQLPHGQEQLESRLTAEGSKHRALILATAAATAKFMTGESLAVITDHTTPRGAWEFGSYDADAEVAALAGQLKQVLSTYALSNVFDRDGCVVYVPAAIRDKRVNRALLVNPERKRRVEAEGNTAVILDLLSDRLRADLVSGLQVDTCGWSTLAAIGERIGTGEFLVGRAVRKLKAMIMQANISGSVIQERHGLIRLNPKLAAASRSRSDSG